MLASCSMRALVWASGGDVLGPEGEGGDRYNDEQAAEASSAARAA